MADKGIVSNKITDALTPIRGLGSPEGLFPTSGPILGAQRLPIRGLTTSVTWYVVAGDAKRQKRSTSSLGPGAAFASARGRSAKNRARTSD